MKLKDDCSLEEKLDKPRQHIKKQRHYFADKVLYSQGCGFSSSHVQMWELTIKKAECRRIDAFELCFWTVVLEKTLESPLDSKTIKPVNSQGNQFWIFIGRTDAKAEAATLWPPDGKADSLEKTLRLWKIESKIRSGGPEDEMVGWHDQLTGHEFEWTPGVGWRRQCHPTPVLLPGESHEQRSLEGYSPWGCKESDMTEWLTFPFLSLISVQFSSVAQSCPTLCDPMDCSKPGLPVHCQLPEFTQTHVHWVSDAIQPFHLLSSPSPPAFNLSQHQGLSKESVLHIRWPKYWSFSFSISPSNEYSGLISLIYRSVT